MSITTRADGALIIRERDGIYVIDLPKRTLSAEFADGTRFIYPISAIERIRIVPSVCWLVFELAGGRQIDVRELPSQELAMRIARPIAWVTRLGIELEVTESRPYRAPTPMREDPSVDVDEDATELEDPRKQIQRSPIPAELVDDIELFEQEEDATLVEPPMPRSWSDPAEVFSPSEEVRITPRPGSLARPSAADSGRRRPHWLRLLNTKLSG
jgi:hypothetical protein